MSKHGCPDCGHEIGEYGCLECKLKKGEVVFLPLGMELQEKREKILIYPPGTLVKCFGIELRVNQVIIDSVGCVSYKCSWWDGNDRKEQWIRDHELSWAGRDRDKLQIGFITQT